MRYPDNLLKLIRALSGLVGVGPKSAQKMGLFLVQNPEQRHLLLDALEGAGSLCDCSVCGNLAEAKTEQAALGAASRSAPTGGSEQAALGAASRSAPTGGSEQAALCPICLDTERTSSSLCVVETINDLIAIERSGEFEGLYHVLGGALNPLEGVGPSQLNIDSLIPRLTTVNEVILATSMTVEGEATSAHLSDLLQRNAQHVAVTRLAYGLPVGGSLEYADEVTLARALEHRRKL